VAHILVVWGNRRHARHFLTEAQNVTVLRHVRRFANSFPQWSVLFATPDGRLDEYLGEILV
jgi:hypothetical protein